MDGGTEFSKFRTWAQTEEGIHFEITPPNTPEPNGAIERAGGVIVRTARSFLLDSGLPAFLWPYAVLWATKILNLLPTSRNEGDKSPHEKYSQLLDLPGEVQHPYYQHIRTFGCVVFVLRKGPHAPLKAYKMEERATKGYFLGSCSRRGHKVHVYLPSRHMVVTARDVLYHETSTYADEEDDNEPEYEIEPASEDEDADAISGPEIIIQPQNTLYETNYVHNNSPLDAMDLPDAPEAPQKDKTALPTPESSPGIASQEVSPVRFSNAMTPRELSPARSTIEVAGTASPDPTDSPESSNSPDPPVPHDPADPVEQFLDSITPAEEADLAEEAPVATDSVIRRSERSAARPRPDYKTLHTGKQINLTYLEPDIRRAPTMQLVLSAIAATALTQQGVPRTYKQARKSAKWDDWKPAFQKQIDDLNNAGVWELVKLPPGSSVLPGKWVLDVKFDANGAWVRNRARWVVCGNFERYDSWEAQEVYSAVANSTSVKLFFILMAVKDLECQQYDIVTAFLHAHAEGDPVYVVQPEGFDDGSGRVCRLRKALYGLRKAPLWWFNTLSTRLHEIGFEPLSTDMCFFKCDRLSALLILYVDDLLIAAPDKDTIKAVEDLLVQCFNLKALGEVHEFLGIQVERNREERNVLLHQRRYTERILEAFAATDLKPAKTPWDHKLSIPAVFDPDESRAYEYSRKTGSVNYLSVNTRPDITFTVGRLSKANKGPNEAYERALQHLFRYLKGTLGYGLLFGGKEYIDKLSLHAYADASFGDNPLTRYSTAGHVIFVAGGPVYWKSKAQTIVAVSTTEAEFINLTPTGLSLMWIANTLAELGYPQERPLLVFTDSANAHAIALNPYKAARTRHIDLRFKWVIDAVKKARFALQHVGTEGMAADGFTKPLQRIKHTQFIRLLNMAAFGG